MPPPSKPPPNKRARPGAKPGQKPRPAGAKPPAPPAAKAPPPPAPAPAPQKAPPPRPPVPQRPPPQAGPPRMGLGRKLLFKGPDPAQVLDRSRGALVGLGVGDALGATLELRKLPAPAFPTLMNGPHTEMTGGGPFKVRPGQATDDSQTAACIAWCIRQLRRYDVEDVTRKYVEWLPYAFDVSAHTRAILESLRQRGNRETVARDHWLRQARRTAGNGSLVRTAPIGVFYAEQDQERAKASLQDSAITHFDPRCQLACAALNGAIAACIRAEGELTKDKVVEGALSALALSTPLLGRAQEEFMREIQDAVEGLKADLQLARKEDPQLYGPELHLLQQESFVRVAFRLAFWELFHAPSFEAALVDVVNRGGDADGNGAVTGALLGAFYGARAIPDRWQKAMLSALGDGRGGPLWDVYHPRHLLLVLDR